MQRISLPLLPRQEISDEDWRNAIVATVPPKYLELNLKAFELGKNSENSVSEL